MSASVLRIIPNVPSWISFQPSPLSGSMFRLSIARTRAHTCFDGVFESGATADQDVVQGRRLALQLPVVQLQQLVRVMEINHFRFPVERLHDVGQQNVHNFLQEGHGFGVAVHGR